MQSLDAFNFQYGVGNNGGNHILGNHYIAVFLNLRNVMLIIGHRKNLLKLAVALRTRHTFWYCTTNTKRIQLFSAPAKEKPRSYLRGMHYGTSTTRMSANVYSDCDITISAITATSSCFNPPSGADTATEIPELLI